MKNSQLLTLPDQADVSTSPSLLLIPCSSSRVQTEVPHLSPHELKSSITDLLTNSQVNPPSESVARQSILKKGANINRVLQKEMNKHKLATQGREKKFQKKFKAFEQLNTFIDIKDYLKQMNTVNNANNAISRPLESLPSLPSIMKSKTHSNVVSPRASEGSSASKTWKLTFSGAVAERTAKRTSSCGGDVGLMLKDARGYITKYLEDQETKIDMNKQPPVRNHRRVSTVVVNSLVNNEEHNNDYFYAGIDDLIAKENLDDFKQFRVQQDVVDFHKSRFKFQPADAKVDEKYYQNYKLRADKVIHLLGVASKKIYNKSLSQKPYKSAKTLPEVKTPQNNPCATPKFESYMSSGKFMDGIEAMESSPSQSLAMKFRRTQHRANTIIKQHDKETTGSGSSCTSILSVADKAKQDKKMNQQLNKVYNNFMNEIVSRVEVEEAHFKNMKYHIQNDISTLEQAYNAQVEQILPKPLESIRKIDPSSTKIFKRSLKTKSSGKMVSTVFD